VFRPETDFAVYYKPSILERTEGFDMQARSDIGRSRDMDIERWILVKGSIFNCWLVLANAFGK
jgi:hypothetical protein